MENVCIAGYGAVAPLHALCLNSINGVRLYAVCDTDARAIEKCRASYDVAAYSDFDEMLKDDNIHCIHICTPHYLHYPMIEKALAAGKRVVAEKPITSTWEDFEKLTALKNADQVCAIVQNRYNHCVCKLRELIRDGILGDIKGIKGIMTWARDPGYYTQSDWKGRWTSEGGSCLINQAFHTLDMMVYLAGSVKTVRASMKTHCLSDHIETEDTVEACLEFSNGIRGLLYGSNNYVDDIPMEIEVVGTKGIARYAYKKLFLNCQMIVDDESSLTEKDYWGCGHYLQLKDFYEKGQYYTPMDISDTMKTVFGIYKSAYYNSQPVEIKENQL